MDYLTYEDLLYEMCHGLDPLFIHGGAGYGKSYLINEMRKVCSGALFTAPSGIAALNIQGLTLHSLFGLKPVTPLPSYNEINKNKKALFVKAGTLLIDEISMVNCDLLDKIDNIFRETRKNDKPFGGMRIIMVGDIFQLQPIIKKESLRLLRKIYPETETFTFFNSKVFKNEDFLDSLKIVNLEYDYRHEKDKDFSQLLSSIRKGKYSTDILEKINNRVSNTNFNGIRLTTTNAIADFLNKKEMDKLPDKIDVSKIEIELFQFNTYLQNDMYPMADELQIKTDMKIMFILNDSIANGKRWVNGTSGIITKKLFNYKNELETLIVSVNENNYKVHKEWYDIYIPYYNEKENIIDYNKIASVLQFPLIAAWAITIHKSQSLTLDSVMLDLGADVFADGQLYVGISRVKYLDHLFINRPVEKKDIKVSSDIIRFYQDFILSKAYHVVKQLDPRIEYKEGMELYMPNSVASNFQSDYDVPFEEVEEYAKSFENTKKKSFLMKILKTRIPIIQNHLQKKKT
jgi:ATP-dependent exoDNAse (exonuclease V) alpha subunit